MNKVESAIKEYQCVGCVNGPFETCFQKAEYHDGCKSHVAGTIVCFIGKIFLGMPKGFNRLGDQERFIPCIYEKFTRPYDKWNIPVWKHVSSEGHVYVRGLMPRTNTPFLHIYLENCSDQINCLEITAEEIEKMD